MYQLHPQCRLYDFDHFQALVLLATVVDDPLRNLDSTDFRPTALGLQSKTELQKFMGKTESNQIQFHFNVLILHILDSDNVPLIGVESSGLVKLFVSCSN